MNNRDDAYNDDDDEHSNNDYYNHFRVISCRIDKTFYTIGVIAIISIIIICRIYIIKSMSPLVL